MPWIVLTNLSPFLIGNWLILFRREEEMGYSKGINWCTQTPEAINLPPMVGSLNCPDESAC